MLLKNAHELKKNSNIKYGTQNTRENLEMLKDVIL